jgi:RNA-directed DNA polymerase
MKPSKGGGGKGGSCSRQDNERRGGLISLNKENISQVQRRLAQAVETDPTYRAKRLFNLVYHPDWLAYALKRVLQNKGSQTPGIDGVTARQFRDEAYRARFLWDLANDLKRRTYQPLPCRRTYIPKPGKRNQQRPLGILVIADRTVQTVMKMILEPLYEGVFLHFSYGFRPSRSTHQALGRTMHFLNHSSGRWHWIIEGDIEACFDRVNHTILLKLLKRRVQDERLLGLVKAFLKAGVLEDGLYRRTDLGTPQGGPISPLLMNVYLHEFDVWLAERYITPFHLVGRSKSTYQRWRRQTHGGSIIPVRYADDWVVLWNGTKAEAECIKTEAARFLQEDLALTLSKTKTRITHIDQGFTFLGYTFRRSRNRQTRKMNVFAQPSQENIRRYRRKVKGIASLMSVPDLTEVFLQYNRVTRGWAAYFRFANCKALLGRLAYYNWWTFYRALRKRHGKRSKRWVLNHYSHRVPSPLGTRTTLGIQIGDELVTMYNLAGVQVKRLRNPNSQAPSPYLEGATTKLDKPFELYPAWNGEESRPGQSRFSRVVRQRDKVCRRCGKAQVKEAHHLQLWSKRPTMDPTQGVGLCKACHAAIHC